MSDAEFREFRSGNPGMTEKCLDDYRYGGFNAWAQEADAPDCYQLMPDQRWSGLWETGWEWTNFCPDPAKECNWMTKRGIWLTFAQGAYDGPKLPEGVYRIDFVGRRTRVPGYHGHTGAYEHLMVVDKLISVRKVPQPPEKKEN